MTPETFQELGRHVGAITKDYVVAGRRDARGPRLDVTVIGRAARVGAEARRRRPWAADRAPTGRQGPAGERGEKGRDGADGKSLTVDDIRGLIELEMAKALLDLERRGMDAIQRSIERIPAPKDGKDGEKGADGLGWQDFEWEYDADGSALREVCARRRRASVRGCRGSLPRPVHGRRPTTAAATP